MRERINPYPIPQELYPKTDYIPEGLGVGGNIQESPPVLRGAPNTESSEKQKAREYTGWLARDIKRGETRDGKPIAWFTLGVKNDEGVTEYKPVVTQGKYVEKLSEQLAKGEPVTLRAYTQPWVSRKDDGSVETQERLFAIHVRSLKAKNTGGTK